ncbi:MAG: alpha/beta hydrolase [Kofleriaceae bacterium]
MAIHTLIDDGAGFEVHVHPAATPTRVVLFAVGAGGDPARHLPLLEALADSGATVVAPCFARMTSPTPTSEELERRARRLRQALTACGPAALPVAGVGHSIGATLLLALAGGQAWMGPGRRLAIEVEPRLDRLALFAPATGYFQAPGALAAVRARVVAWAGTRDTMTPPAQARYLAAALGPTAEVRIIDGAGHFSFMDVPPPHSVEPLPDRAVVLAELARATVSFVVGA